MNHHSSTNPKCIRCGAWVLMLVTLLQLAWLQCQPESSLRTLYALAVNRGHKQPVFLSEEGRALGAGFTNGNVFLRVVVSPNTNSASLSSHSFFDYQEYYLSVWYYRMSYEFYPRRVFIGPATVVINEGWDMMQGGFSPDDAWLQAHDVRSILTLGFDEHGKTLPAQWTAFTPANGGNP